MNRVRSLGTNRWVRYVLTLLLVSLVIVKISPNTLLHAAAGVRPLYLGLALALTVPFLALKMVRWHIMLLRAGIESERLEAALSLLGGMALALLTPGRIGEVVRASYIRDPRKWKVGGLVMVDKGFDVLVLVILSIPGAWVLLGPISGLAASLIAICGLAVVYEPRPLSRALHRASRPLPFRNKLEQVWECLETLTPRSSSLFLALTAASFAVVLVQFGLLLLTWRSWSPDAVFLTFPLVILTNVLPITIGGLGLREATAAILLAHYGVPHADAALAAFLMFAVNTAIPGLVGAALVPALRTPGGTR